MQVKFDRSKNVSLYEAFAEIIKDTIRFFNGTPVHQLPPPENFVGAGVYALYYIGKSEYYKHLYDANRLNFVLPIYVGKAVPHGWPQASQQEASNELYTRLCEHYYSISQADNLNIDDFRCRYMILEDEETDLIGTIEASLIRQYTQYGITASMALAIMTQAVADTIRQNQIGTFFIQAVRGQTR